MLLEPSRKKISNGCLFLFFFIILVLFSCKAKILSKDQLIKYVDENKELNKTHEANGVVINLRYFPHQLLVYQELGDSKEGGKIQEIEKKYSSNYYFKASFSKNNKEVIRQLGSFKEYSDMLQVFSFEMGKHINITTNDSDTLYLKGCSFDQNFGLTSANTLTLVFDKNDFKGHNLFKINIGEFGLRIGNLNFPFSTEEIYKVPGLDYSKSITNK
jgi:hypothetical protein